MYLPFGEIKDNTLKVTFSSADYSVANVITAVKERCDMFKEMQVVFLGACTEVPAGPSPVFKPVGVQAIFEYTGSDNAKKILERVYVQLWEALALTFPDETEWARAKSEYGHYISSQADLIRARTESNRTD